MSGDVLITEVNDNDKTRIYITSKDNKVSIRKCGTNNTVNIAFLNIVTVFKDVFLPQGFPDSVHSDYIKYQIWDTVQAFASTIMGTLTTHSILKGVGVGEASATPLAATITWILKDGMGMFGGITFTWWKGSDLDRQCKKWRLFADILNDIAMGIELLVPHFSTYSLVMLCVSTTMKSIVGIVGGATRAALTQHQALQNNLADVSAKDRSQETCVNLIASFAGIFILSLFHDGRFLMELYLLLVSIHLYANYSAVKALRLNSFNEDRLCLAIENYILESQVPNPDVINDAESVMLFTRPSKAVCEFSIRLGASLCRILQKNITSPKEVQKLLTLYKSRRYLLIHSFKQRTIFVCLAENVKSGDCMKAYFHAFMFGLSLSFVFPVSNDKPNGLSCTTNLLVDEAYVDFIDKAVNNGWDVNSNLLPVESSRIFWEEH